MALGQSVPPPIRLATRDGHLVANTVFITIDLASTGGGKPPPGPPADEDAAERKLAAKRYNEGTKLVASALNTLGLGVLGFGVVQPLIKDPAAFVLEYRPVLVFRRGRPTYRSADRSTV